MAGRYRAGLLAVGKLRDRVRLDGLTFEQAGAECLPPYTRQSAHRAVRLLETRFGLRPEDPTPPLTHWGLAPTGQEDAPQPSSRSTGKGACIDTHPEAVAERSRER